MLLLIRRSLAAVLVVAVAMPAWPATIPPAPMGCRTKVGSILNAAFSTQTLSPASNTSVQAWTKIWLAMLLQRFDDRLKRKPIWSAPPPVIGIDAGDLFDALPSRGRMSRTTKPSFPVHIFPLNQGARLARDQKTFYREDLPRLGGVLMAETNDLVWIELPPGQQAALYVPDTENWHSVGFRARKDQAVVLGHLRLGPVEHTHAMAKRQFKRALHHLSSQGMTQVQLAFSMMDSWSGFDSDNTDTNMNWLASEVDRSGFTSVPPVIRHTRAVADKSMAAHVLISSDYIALDLRRLSQKGPYPVRYWNTPPASSRMTRELLKTRLRELEALDPTILPKLKDLSDANELLVLLSDIRGHPTDHVVVLFHQVLYAAAFAFQDGGSCLRAAASAAILDGIAPEEGPEIVLSHLYASGAALTWVAYDTLKTLSREVPSPELGRRALRLQSIVDSLRTDSIGLRVALMALATLAQFSDIWRRLVLDILMGSPSLSIPSSEKLIQSTLDFLNTLQVPYASPMSDRVVFIDDLDGEAPAEDAVQALKSRLRQHWGQAMESRWDTGFLVQPVFKQTVAHSVPHHVTLIGGYYADCILVFARLYIQKVVKALSASERTESYSLTLPLPALHAHAWTMSNLWKNWMGLAMGCFSSSQTVVGAPIPSFDNYMEYLRWELRVDPSLKIVIAIDGMVRRILNPAATRTFTIHVLSTPESMDTWMDTMFGYHAEYRAA